MIPVISALKHRSTGIEVEFEVPHQHYGTILSQVTAIQQHQPAVQYVMPLHLAFRPQNRVGTLDSRCETPRDRPNSSPQHARTGAVPLAGTHGVQREAILLWNTSYVQLGVHHVAASRHI